MSKQHYHGHRERVRKRFLQQGLEGFQDYEALEMLLLYVARQKDMKPVAKALIQRFGSFKGVLDAPQDELEEINGVGPAAVALIHFVKQTAARYLRQTTQTRFSLENPESLVQYCIVSMGAEPNEKFRVICLVSALAVHKLTIQIPHAVDIAVQKQANHQTSTCSAYPLVLQSLQGKNASQRWKSEAEPKPREVPTPTIGAVRSF